jgi:putative transposase
MELTRTQLKSYGRTPCSPYRPESAVPSMDPERRRKPTRLRGYDYRTPALYHVVANTQGNICQFGTVQNGLMQSNAIGQMIQEIWDAIPESFPGASLETSIVMPNHHHGIVFIEPGDDNAPRPSLGGIMKWFKTVTTVRYSRGVREAG